VIDPLIEPAPVFGQSLDDPHHAERATAHGRHGKAAVETAVIDVVDAPIPAVMRVTAIEEICVTLRDPDAPTSRDIPEPDSFGG
jgi:hypothetical protein